MKQRHIVSSIVVVAVLAMALAAIAGPAAASGHTPNDNTTYDVYDGSTVNVYEMNSSNTSKLTVNTSNSVSISSINVTVSYNETDSDGNETREIVLYQADNDSSDYNGTDDVDANDDTTAESDRHTWTINHSELKDAPVMVNESTELYVEVVSEDGSGNAGYLNFTFNISNADDRSVVVVDDDSVDDDAVGSSVTTISEETGTFAWVPGLSGENETDYVIEETRDINGSETNVEYRLMGDAADAFDAATSGEDGLIMSEEAPSSGDIIFEMAATADGTDVIPVYMDEAGDEVDNGTDTYAVYDSDSDVLTVYYGEDYSDASTVEPYIADHAPDDENLDPGADELAEAYGHLDFRTYADGLGTWDAISVWRSDADATFAFVLPLVAAPAGARARTEG